MSIVLQSGILSQGAGSGPPPVTNIYTHNFGGGPGVPLVGVPVSYSSGLYGGVLLSSWAANGDLPGDIHSDGEFISNALGAYGGSALPFVPVSGVLYSLSATIAMSSITGGDWAGLGFLGANNEAYVSGAAWLLLLSSGADPVATYPFAVTEQVNHNAASAGLTVPPFTATFRIELDTRSALWKFRVYANDLLLRDYTYATNPTINFVGIMKFWTAAGHYSSFTLDAVPAVAPTAFETLIRSRGPMVWYRNNAPSGNQAIDSSGYGNHGLYQATSDAVLGDLDLPTPQPTVDVAGILYNQPGPGSDPVIEITSTTAGMRHLGEIVPVGTSAFTFEQWFCPTDLAGIVNNTLAVGYSVDTGTEAQLSAAAPDQQASFSDRLSYAMVRSTGATAANNVWRHVVGVADGANMRLYIDGVLHGTVANSTNPGGGKYNLAMGYFYANRASAHVLGRYGDCMIYPSALTEAQIIENRNARLGI